MLCCLEFAWASASPVIFLPFLGVECALALENLGVELGVNIHLMVILYTSYYSFYHVLL